MGVIDIFIPPNPSNRTMAPEFIQPVAETSIARFSG
jgi:hypothetical protein